MTIKKLIARFSFILFFVLAAIFTILVLCNFNWFKAAIGPFFWVCVVVWAIAFLAKQVDGGEK
jgi:hypothetical protein